MTSAQQSPWTSWVVQSLHALCLNARELDQKPCSKPCHFARRLSSYQSHRGFLSLRAQLMLRSMVKSAAPSKPESRNATTAAEEKRRRRRIQNRLNQRSFRQYITLLSPISPIDRLIALSRTPYSRKGCFQGPRGDS